MHLKINFIVFLIGFLAVIYAAPTPASSTSPGKYKHRKNEGRYISKDEGKYTPMVWPYVHQPDYRELGKYVHVHIPYDGGFGPYSGFNLPYDHDASGGYSLFTTTTTTTPRPTTTTPKTTTTTTRRPTKPYDDEGKWKVIRHEQEKNQKKYDYLFLTENGIYAEEQAKLVKSQGTSATGYYEYIGDDDKVYRVNYSTGAQGFVPMGDHIPTPPPIPKEIQKALDYVAAKKNKAANKAAAASANAIKLE